MLSSQSNQTYRPGAQPTAAAAAHLNVDVVVAGGGYTGLLAALCLDAVRDGNVRIAIIDRGPGATMPGDPRCFALSAGSRNLLVRLGIWPALAAHAQDVAEIVITDSALEAAVRPVLLRYDNHLDDGTAAASIVTAQALREALQAAVRDRPSIAEFDDACVTEMDTDGPRARISSADGRTWSADLVIAADGRSSRIREIAGIKTNRFPHRQTGIVTTISHSQPHDARATQHFLPAGPFAILPLPGNRSCITWSEDETEANRILSLDDDGFLDEIERRVAGQLGSLALAGPRGSFPLSTQIARQFVSRRVALTGDAAHGVHPIAGQGLNLAMRDVAALAERIAEAARVGLAYGDPTALEDYQQWRRFDSVVSAGVFDALNRLFSKDFALLRAAREIGLGIVDRAPAIKRRLVQEAAGLSGDIPKLMRT